MYLTFKECRRRLFTCPLPRSAMQLRNCSCYVSRLVLLQWRKLIASAKSHWVPISWSSFIFEPKKIPLPLTLSIRLPFAVDTRGHFWSAGFRLKLMKLVNPCGWVQRRRWTASLVFFLFCSCGGQRLGGQSLLQFCALAVCRDQLQRVFISFPQDRQLQIKEESEKH